MTVVVSCVNLKGGVGKTTLSVNMAAHFGIKGKKVLLIDLDPQTNATFSCITYNDWETHASKHGSIADVLGARQHSNGNGKLKKISDVLKKNVFKNVDLIPSHLDLFTVDLDMASATARETRLRKALNEVSDNYDLIVCDCPPNLTIPTQNALAASNFFVVPISADYLSALGIGLLIKRIRQLENDLELNLTHAGIVISRVGRPAHHRDEIVLALKSQFPGEVLINHLTERVDVSKGPSQQKSVFDMNNEEAKLEFTLVFNEIAKKIGL